MRAARASRQSRNEVTKPGEGKGRTGMAVGTGHMQGPVAARVVGGGGEEDGVGWGVVALCGGGDGGLEGGQVAGAGEVEDVVCFVGGEEGVCFGWHCGAWCGEVGRAERFGGVGGT